MSKVVISVENLTKKYDLGVIGAGTLARDLERWWARVHGQPDPSAKIGSGPARGATGETILALDDVSFTVEQGDTLGIIGRNGAGKSTLLKILSRVTAPTSGRVRVRGRIGSLLEVGTGFHPELTGRENVFLNGAILGMKRAEVQRKFDEIVDFSGVEKFIDTPVKRYSSGMYVRLAFAVAAHLDPEILIVDEVLAVGDAEFQKKCLGKMGDVASEGRTVLFVSHNMVSIQRLCKKGIFLHQGMLVQDGDAESVVSNYLARSKQRNIISIDTDERKGDFRIKISNFTISPANPQTGHPIQCNLTVYVDEQQVTKTITADFSISFVTEYGFKIFQLHSGHMQDGLTLHPGTSHIITEVGTLPLTPGTYKINLWVGSGNVIHDWIPEAYIINIDPGAIHGEIFVDNRGYPVVAPSNWRVE